MAEICRRLDGLHLAPELAAARNRMMSPSSLLARLDRSLEVLTRGARDLADRQRTLRAAISWSYNLLDEDEKRLFCRFGVFSGRFTTDAAEAVADRGDLSIPIWEGLTSLVDKSLVRFNDTEEDRFSMLETIREFSEEKLEEFDKPDIIRTAHAEFFRALAEDAWRNLIGAQAEAWLRRLDTEIANLRSALSDGVIYVPETALATARAL